MTTSELKAENGTDNVKEFKSAIDEALQTSSEALKSVEQMSTQISQMLDEDLTGGISLYDLKNHELSGYLLNLSLLMGKMALGESIENSEALNQLVKLRVVSK